MIYLKDEDILNWNKKIDGIFVMPVYNSNSGYPDISINNDITVVHSNEQFNVNRKDKKDISNINFKIRFSVESSMINLFFDIFKSISSMEIGTKENKKQYNKTDKLLRHLFFDESILINKKVNTHKLGGVEFKRFDYYLKGDLSSIIIYNYVLEKSILFFQKLYENGGKSADYNKGDIVSLKTDKSKDFLIVDYHFDVMYDKIKFIACEIFTKRGSNIINYGEDKIYSSDDICISRNNNINSILKEN